MARPARRVVCDESIKNQLLGIAKSRKLQFCLNLRAKIMLQCLEDRPVKEIARACNVSDATVIRWKNRFIADGLAGLSDHYRSGRPAAYQEEFKRTVLEKLEQAPPDGFAQWDGTLPHRSLDTQCYLAALA